MAQEETAERQIGHLRRCHTCFTKIRSQSPTYSFFLFLKVMQDIQTCRSKADCGSQRHPRPSRIISALEQSIILVWGLNVEGKKQSKEHLEENC